MGNQSICLVGLMGAGKTTIGRLLSRRLGWEFLDSDHEVEARTGVSIPTIFEIEGEEGFRRRESATIQELSDLPRIVLATGGGAVLSPENRQCIRRMGLVVYLEAPPECLIERLRHDRSRPLLRVPDPLAKLRELYVLRDPLYREVAGLVVNVARDNTGSIVKRINHVMEAGCQN